LKIPQFSAHPAFQGMPWKAGWRLDSPMLLPSAGGRGRVIKIGELVMILDLHRQGLKWPPFLGP
jgi:hypothetical protein